MAKNCYVTSRDPMLAWLYDPATVEDYFGPDFMEEWGHELPQGLVDRVLKCQGEIEEVQRLLREATERR